MFSLHMQVVLLQANQICSKIEKSSVTGGQIWPLFPPRRTDADTRANQYQLATAADKNSEWGLLWMEGLIAKHVQSAGTEFICFTSPGNGIHWWLNDINIVTINIQLLNE